MSLLYYLCFDETAIQFPKVYCGEGDAYDKYVLFYIYWEIKDLLEKDVQTIMQEAADSMKDPAERDHRAEIQEIKVNERMTALIQINEQAEQDAIDFEGRPTGPNPLPG